MAPAAQFLTLSPARNIIIAASTATVVETPDTAATAIAIPIVEKTERSDSVTSDYSTASPRSSVDGGVVNAEAATRFLKLGN